MGMDVIGLAPRSEKGKCFTNNNQSWRDLADYCNEVAPDVCGACKYWYTNDGDGLDDAGAVALAGILKDRIKDGGLENRSRMIAAYDQREDRTLLNLPDGRQMPLRWLWAMLGPSQTFADRVASFADFLEDCGGFEIW